MPATTFADILKFNPYHDARGRFASANSATSFTHRTKDPSKQHLADKAKEREKERAAGAAADTDGESAQMATVHSVEDRIRSQFYESAAVVDKDGKILLRKDGALGEVGFTKEETKLLEGNTVTHNHPDDTMLSVADAFIFVKYGIEEMRATTKDGTTYSLKQGSEYNEERARRFVVDYDGEMKSARLLASREVVKYREKVMDGEMTEDQVTYEYGKVVTSEMVKYCEKYAARYNIDFSVEKRDVDPASTFEIYTGKSADNDGAEPQEKNSFSIYKTSDDKRLVFGWASVSITVDGEQLEDRQNDIIEPEDLEEAAYEYVLNFRDTGELHNPNMRKKGKLVESCVFTVEKQKAMGIPEGILPVGWWIGFKIEDDDAWERVKNGTYKMFSIEGKANREPVTE